MIQMNDQLFGVAVSHQMNKMLVANVVMPLKRSSDHAFQSGFVTVVYFLVAYILLDFSVENFKPYQCNKNWMPFCTTENVFGRTTRSVYTGTIQQHRKTQHCDKSD